MSGFYVLAVPEFASLIDAAVKSGAGKVHPQRGHYQFVEFESEIVHTSVCDMTFFRDPDGNVLILHRRFAPFSDGRVP